MTIQFKADHIQVSGPKASDGSYKVTFETGEYSQEQVAALLMIPQRTVITVSVEYQND